MTRFYRSLLLIVLFWTTATVATVQAQTIFFQAVDDTAFVLVDGTVDIDVLANDIQLNAGCNKVLVDILEGPFNSILDFPDGTFIERSDPTRPDDDFIVYVPNAGYAGRDSLKYELGRGGPNCGGIRIDSAWVHIYVNRPPDAQNDTLQVLPDIASTLSVLDNDVDADGDALTIDNLGVLPENGTAVTDGATIMYTPNAGYLGPDSLFYHISDDKLGTDSAWVFLTVNRPPVAVADSATTLPNMAVTIDALANDSDPEGGALSFAGFPDEPTNGTITANGVIVYTPDAGFVGSDMFTYTVTDPVGGTATTSVYVLVNNAPVAADDEETTIFEVPIDLDVLANDTDADDDPLSVEAITTAPENGTAAIINDGQRIRYTPNADFFGTDMFVYRAGDGRGSTDEATVTVIVSADAAVQFIHNALPAGLVDIYVNDVLTLDDFDFQTATAYLAVPAGTPKVDVTEGSATNNSAPFFTATPTLVPQETYIAIANGVAGQNFDVLIKTDARPVAADTNATEFFIVHGVLDAPASGIDVRVLDPDNENMPSQTLADDINFEEMTDYQGLQAAIYNLDAASFNGATQYDAYQFDLSGLKGQTFTLVLSGLLSPAAGEPPFTLIGYDAQGNTLVPAIVTDTEAAVELPETFTLRGNYPNPFNPSTTVSFDLPEAADVTLDVVDLLGRVVLTVPSQAVEAGANQSLTVNASTLASGTYFYRLIARTATDTQVRTGQMLLVK